LAFEQRKQIRNFFPISTDRKDFVKRPGMKFFEIEITLAKFRLWLGWNITSRKESRPKHKSTL
jgi:hypothetical protein